MYEFLSYIWVILNIVQNLTVEEKDTKIYLIWALIQDLFE